ncbi:IDEAL domain-containing protein [Clostridium botulinum]|nr:IDEAL domain-containing protein [Clostridium botulinum]EKS4395753.1 IDEAL domain-containing protein [Clostridium botulinum]
MIKISGIQDKEFIKDMINIALETKDREWFNQLTDELKKLEKEDDSEIDLFNPKSNYEGYCDDLFKYEYYICQTDCDFGKGQPVAIVDNKIYGNISNQEILNEVEFIVQLIGDKKYKNGDKIPKLELKMCDDNLLCTALWFLGYLGGKTDIKNYCNIIKQKNELLDKEVESLKKYNDLLKSELETFQSNYFTNKEDKKFKWKFWKQ